MKKYRGSRDRDKNKYIISTREYCRITLVCVTTSPGVGWFFYEIFSMKDMYNDIIRRQKTIPDGEKISFRVKNKSAAC